MIDAKLAAAGAALLWLLWPKKAAASPGPTANVDIGDDVEVTFVPSGDGTPWNDVYRKKDGAP